MNPPRFAPFTLALAALALSGCASIERDWFREQQREIGTTVQAPCDRKSHDAFTGRWDGRWTSAKHHKSSGEAMGGRLRCILTKLDERRYDAHFKANWLIFASSYRTTFQVERRGRELLLAGEHALTPMFGGVYKYQGRVTPDHFAATYDSAYDHGAFEMRRPQSRR